MAKILCLCSRIPYPLTGGAKIRLFNTAALLAKDHTVDLLIVDEEKVVDDRITPLQSTFNDVFLFTYPKYRFYLGTLPGLVSRRPLQTFYFSFRGLDRWLDEHAADYDLLYCNHVRTTEYARGRAIPKVVDLVDAISRNYVESSRGASGLWRMIYPIESKRLLRYERTVVQQFDHSFITTSEDKAYIERDASTFESLSVVPNGVQKDLLSVSPSERPDPTIVYLGKMNYFPNEDAVVYFADQIFPHIREEHPEVAFRIVGTNPTSRVTKLGHRPGINVTGFVDDPIEYLANATVVVAPLRFGAGLQNKVLEAMALQKAVVTSELGAEGIEGTHGIHFECASNPRKFAQITNSLLEDANRRRALGQNARKLIAKKYTWDIVGTKLLGPINEVIGRSFVDT